MFFYIMFGFTFVSGQNTFITTITNIKKKKKKQLCQLFYCNAMCQCC